MARGIPMTDAALLTALAMRDAGYSTRAIGRAIGHGPGAVAKALRRIDRDLALSERGAK